MKNKFLYFSLTTFAIVSSALCISFTKTDSQESKLLSISKEYKTYRQFGKENEGINWTIAPCASPMEVKGKPDVKDSLHYSMATVNASKHGNKLYKLFIKNYIPYIDTNYKTQAIGQVIVKETWNVKEVQKDSLKQTKAFVKKSENDGKYYTPTTVSEIFVMYKEKKSKRNDEGWVYGIVSLEKEKQAKPIIEKGKISNCISCHKDTKYDRMFGVK